MAKPFRRIEPFKTSTIAQREVRPDDVKPIVQKPVPKDFDYDEINVAFYGRKLVFKADPSLKDFNLQEVNKKAFSRAWTTLSIKQTGSMVRQAYEYKKSLNLNDWAIFMRMNMALVFRTSGYLNLQQHILPTFILNKIFPGKAKFGVMYLRS